MPQKNLPRPRTLKRPLVAAKLFAALLVVIISGPQTLGARTQRGGQTRAGQAQNQGPAAAQKTERKKRVFVGRSSDTGQGSRQSIKSDNPLNDYSAYRSGDRFYVVLPKADANSIPTNDSGRGFSDMKVQQRGSDVVLSYRVQPGAKPRVEQKFNRLDVIIDAPETAGAATTQAGTSRPAQPAQGSGEGRNQAGGTTPAASTQRQPQTPAPTPNAAATTAPRPSPAGAQTAAPATAAAPSELAQSQTSAVPTPAVNATPSPAAPQEIAQAQPPTAAAPGSITADRGAPTAAAPGLSLGALLLNNWAAALAIALLVIGLGLFVVTRRAATSGPPALPPAADEKKSLPAWSTSKPGLQEASPSRAAKAADAWPAAERVDVAPAATAAALTAPALIAPTAEAEAESARAEEEAALAEEAAALAEEEAEDLRPATAPAPVEEPEVIAPALAAGVAVTPEVATEVEPAAAEAEPAAHEIMPVAAPAEPAPPMTADAEHVRAEVRRLLDGEHYNKPMIGTADMMTRQLIAAELLSALAGRSALRHARARKAFTEHGYFNETAHDLHFAAAPAERSAAARSLAIVGDRAATSHLIAALDDPTVEVRRAAVEALTMLRDPKAVGPLEALLIREQHARDKVHRKLVRRAIDTCAEAVLEEAITGEVLPEAPGAEIVAGAPVLDAAAAGESSQATESPASAEELAGAPTSEATLVGEQAVIDAAPVEETRVEDAAAEEALPSVEETWPEVDEALSPQTLAGGPSAIEDEWLESVEIELAPSAAKSARVEHEVDEAAPAEESVLTPEPALAEEPSPAAAASPESEAGIEPYAGRESVEVTAIEVAEAGAHADVKELEVAAPVKGLDVAEAATEDWTEIDLNETEAAAVAEASIEPYEPAAETPPGELGQAGKEIEQAAAPAGLVAEEEPYVAEVVSSPQFEKGIKRADETRAGSAAGRAAPVADDRAVEPFDEMSTVPHPLQQRLTSADTTERAAAIAELSRLDTTNAFQQICAAFDDEAKEVRGAAARALYELKPDRADSFTRALREADAERRRNIGAAISSSGLAGEAIGQLTGESRDRTYEAFSLLFLMAKAGEVQPLIRAIEGHPDNEVRLAVVKLLALSGQKDILPAFRRLAVRGSLPTEVRSAVMEAIYQISSSQPDATRTA